MFKLKKIILVILCITPLLTAVWFGYPVKTYTEEMKGRLTYTKRCFKVGELGEFFRCFSERKTISRQLLLKDLRTKTSSLFPFFDVIFYGAVLLSVLVLLSV